MDHKESDPVTVESVNSPRSASPVEKSKDVDDALVFVKEQGSIDWTEGEESKLVRKLDMWLMPLLVLMNLFSYFDSQVFGIGAIFNMVQDLKLYDLISLDPLILDLTKYSWAAALPNFGALLSLYPILYLAQRLAIGKVTAAITLWSAAFSLLMLALRGYKGAMAIRFLYGFQGATIPLCVIITAMWYKTSEQPMRVAIWNTGSTLGAIIGQAIDLGAISIKDGIFGDSPWKYMYLIFGTLAAAYSIGLFFVLPDAPFSARFLKPRERQIAVQRLQSNNTGIHNKSFKLKQALAAWKDPQIWALACSFLGISFCNAGFATFGALLVQTFPEVSTERALVLLMPAAAVAVVVILLSGILSTMFPRRRITIGISFLIPTVIGNVLLWKLHGDRLSPLLAGLYLAVCFYGSYVQLVGLVASNIGGNTKKSVANATIALFSAAGSIAAPFALKGQEATQGYPTGVKTLLGMTAMIAACFVFLIVWYGIQNKKKDIVMETLSNVRSQEQMAFMDLTESENPYFRYTY